MSGYTVLATRYRPRAFGEVVGQEDAARILKTAIATGRAAHAYLFSGPRGVGKTSMARILAKAWNCLDGEPGEPCGSCRVCRTIDESGDGLDVSEIDGASHNRVENVRELIEKLRFRPAEARHRVTIIDEVHMLSTSAFNALLKTLEEPPPHAKFILATTEPLKVPETIRSRCQSIDFRRLQADEIAGRIEAVCRAESVELPAALAQRIARQAKGGMRDALSLLDQLLTFGEGAPTLEHFERLTGRLSPELVERILRAAVAGDVVEALAGGEEAAARGARPADLLAQLADELQALLVVVAGGRPSQQAPEDLARLERLAEGLDLDRLLTMLDVVVEAQHRLRQRHDGRLVADLALTTLARTSWLRPIAEVLAGERGATPPAPRPTRQPAATDSGAGQPGPARPRAAPSTAKQPPGAPRRVAPSTAPPAAAPSQAAAPTVAAPPGPSPAASAASGAPGEDELVARFIAAAGKGSRTLRTELSRYLEIRLDGTDLLLRPPAGGPSPAFDPGQDAELRRRLQEAAVTVGASRVRVLGEETASEAPAAGPGDQAQGRGSEVEQRIARDWPGAERVDM